MSMTEEQATQKAIDAAEKRAIPGVLSTEGNADWKPNKFVRPPIDVKVLTVPQPWAWAIFNAELDILNTDSDIASDFDGLIAIQAGEDFDDSYVMHPAVWDIYDKFPTQDSGEYVLGKILGTVRVASFGPSYQGLEPSKWANPEATYWLSFGEAKLLQEPIEYNDSLDSGLRDLPEDTKVLLREHHNPVGLPASQLRISNLAVLTFSGGDPHQITAKDQESMIQQAMKNATEMATTVLEPEELEELESTITEAVHHWVKSLQDEFDALVASKAKSSPQNRVTF